jgi:hypothetical protein
MPGGRRMGELSEGLRSPMGGDNHFLGAVLTGMRHRAHGRARRSMRCYVTRFCAGKEKPDSSVSVGKNPGAASSLSLI